jgi:hypothetical protein
MKVNGLTQQTIFGNDGATNVYLSRGLTAVTVHEVGRIENLPYLYDSSSSYISSSLQLIRDNQFFHNII